MHTDLVELRALKSDGTLAFFRERRFVTQRSALKGSGFAKVGCPLAPAAQVRLGRLVPRQEHPKNTWVERYVPFNLEEYNMTWKSRTSSAGPGEPVNRLFLYAARERASGRPGHFFWVGIRTEVRSRAPTRLALPSNFFPVPVQVAAERTLRLGRKARSLPHVAADLF